MMYTRSMRQRSPYVHVFSFYLLCFLQCSRFVLSYPTDWNGNYNDFLEERELQERELEERMDPGDSCPGPPPFNPLDNFPNDFPDGRPDKDADGNQLTNEKDANGVPWVSTMLAQILSVVDKNSFANPVFYTDAVTPPDVMKSNLDDYILKQLSKRGFSFKSGTPVDWLLGQLGLSKRPEKGDSNYDKDSPRYWTAIYRASEALAMAAWVPNAPSSGDDNRPQKDVEVFVFMKLNSYKDGDSHDEAWKVDTNSEVGAGFTWLYTECPTIMRNKKVARMYAVDPDTPDTRVKIWDANDPNDKARDSLQFIPMDTIKGVTNIPKEWFPWGQ